MSYSDAGDWIGVVVASDTEKKKSLHIISVPMLVETFRKVAYEDIVTVTQSVNSKGEVIWTNIIGEDRRFQ